MSKVSKEQALDDQPLQSPAALLVDAGNTRIKWTLWTKGGYAEQQAQSYESGMSPTLEALRCLTALIADLKPPRLVLVHVLGDELTQAVSVLSEKCGCMLSLVNTASNTYGITVAYENPAHFGADRLVALLAARDRVGDHPAIVIDCGTAVTIDALAVDNQHLGGVILPGLNLLSDSLIQRTQAKHMSASVFDAPSLFANNTTQAIGSGCLFSLVGAIEGICQRMQSKMLAKPLKIICGGDAGRVHAHLSGDSGEYQLEPSALMRGLSVIAGVEQGVY